MGQVTSAIQHQRPVRWPRLAWPNWRMMTRMWQQSVLSVGVYGSSLEAVGRAETVQAIAPYSVVYLEGSPQEFAASPAAGPRASWVTTRTASGLAVPVTTEESAGLSSHIDVAPTHRPVTLFDSVRIEYRQSDGDFRLDIAYGAIISQLDCALGIAKVRQFSLKRPSEPDRVCAPRVRPA